MNYIYYEDNEFIGLTDLEVACKLAKTTNEINGREVKVYKLVEVACYPRKHFTKENNDPNIT